MPTDYCATVRLIAFVLPWCAGTLFAAEKPQLWLYYPTNLAVDRNVEEIRRIWTRAAAAGYDHVLLTDSKFAKLGDLGDNQERYFKNIAEVKRIAGQLKLQIVPALFEVGYSNDLLWHDPNLAEGLPVKDQPFVVHHGEAMPATDFHLPAKFAFKDDDLHVEGNTATLTDPSGNARFCYHLKTPQFRCYHISVKIKTDDFHGTPEIPALADGNGNRNLQWQSLGVKPTQDWTVRHVVFNSLDNNSINLYFGVWGGAKGTLQWKDWKIEQCPLVNVLRRPGTPFLVKNEQGQTLTEGTDYDPVVDPNLGDHPWKGAYDAWHAPVPIKTHLPEGTKLLVSWYHPAIIYDEQVSACIEEPEMNDLLADEAKRVRAAWGSAGYMMSHDEFRTLGWDDSCESTHKTPGQMLADNIRFCTKLLEGSDAYVWSDMFDPYHNAWAAAKGPYYLVKGPWAGSWEGLDRDVTVVNWNFEQRDQSLKFFADRGNKQLIAGYYDAPLERSKQWVESAKKIRGVIGYMYTTWGRNYGDLEGFAKVVQGSK